MKRLSLRNGVLMENTAKSWQDTIPFGYYKMGSSLNKIRVEKLELVITLNSPSKSLSEADSQIMKIFINNNNLDKLLGKEQKVTVLFVSSNSVSTKDCRFNLNLRMWDYSLKVAGQEVGFYELLREFQRKDATHELKNLFTSTNKEGKFFEFGKNTLIEYYMKDEDSFQKFCELFVDNQFSLPDNANERNSLLDFVNEGEPGAGHYLQKYIPTVSERKAKKNSSLKIK